MIKISTISTRPEQNSGIYIYIIYLFRFFKGHDWDKDRHIPFLDLLLWNMDDGAMDFEVYRKPTHSGKY